LFSQVVFQDKPLGQPEPGLSLGDSELAAFAAGRAGVGGVSRVGEAIDGAGVAEDGMLAPWAGVVFRFAGRFSVSGVGMGVGVAGWAFIAVVRGLAHGYMTRSTKHLR